MDKHIAQEGFYWFCWVNFIPILSYLPSSAFQYLHRHVNMLSYFKAYFLKHLNSYKDFITGKWYLSNQEIHAFKIHYLKQRFSDEGITSVKNHIRRSLRWNKRESNCRKNSNRQMESCFSGIQHFMQACRLNSGEKSLVI